MASDEEFLEIRVHGVHGTSPSSMLGVATNDLGQVAGDGLTGVYRTRDPNAKLPYRDFDTARGSVEAYSWGALTSGISGMFGWLKRALWLLLLPSALVNLSYWARLELGLDKGQARWGARAIRLGALLITVFMVLTPCLIGIDLVSWQCFRGGSPGCSSLPGALDFLARIEPAQRLAFGSLAPLLVVAVLWLLSRQSLSRYEAVNTRDETTSRIDVLRHPQLWNGMRRTVQLQRMHLSVALAVVVGFSGIHTLRFSDKLPWPILLTVIGAGVVTLLSVCWLSVLHPDDVDHRPEHTSWVVEARRKLPEELRSFLRQRLPEWLLRVMGGLCLAHLLLLLTVGGAMDETQDFAGSNLWFIGVFVVLTAIHLSVFTGGRMNALAATIVVLTVFVLGGVALAAHEYGLPHRVGWVAVGVVIVLWAMLMCWHYRQGLEHRDVAWNGAGASVLLAAAAWIALLFTTGLVTATADALNGGDHGVDDLVSRSSTPSRDAAEAYPAPPTPTDRDRAGPPRFKATGDVVAKDATLLINGKKLTLVLGKLSSDSLYQASAGPGGPRANLSRALDSTRTRAALVTLPDSSLAVEDSCLRAAPPKNKPLPRCSAESDTFVPAGTLPLAGKVLEVVADHGKVTLEVTKPPQMPLVVPQVLIWAPMAQLLWLLLLVAYGVMVAVRVRRIAQAIATQVERDTDIALQDRPPCVAARRSAALAHRAERIVDGVGAVTALIAIGLIVASSRGDPPWDLWSWTRNIATPSMYVAAGLGLGLLALGSRIRKSEETRKAVGILWDLTTFWPRAAHPLAPPCYAERVVPELTTRITWALRQRNTVIVSGHSQGSTIVASVLSRLSRDQLRHVRVVTYGSQIRALYGRIFPRVFGAEPIGYVPTPGPATLGDPFPDVPREIPAEPSYRIPDPSPISDGIWEKLPLMDRIFAGGGGWVNLFRRSDPLGWRIFSDTDEAPDHYVPEVPPGSAGDPGPEVATHGHYPHTYRYRTVVAGWTREDVVEDETGTTRLPTFPAP